MTRLASDMLQEEAPKQLDMQVRSERRVLALGGDCKVDPDSCLKGQSSRWRPRSHQHLVLKRGEAPAMETSEAGGEPRAGTELGPGVTRERKKPRLWLLQRGQRGWRGPAGFDDMEVR